MMSNKPRLFIGSASESLNIARALESELIDVARTERWDKAFRPGYYTLDELSRKASEVDFAVFILGQEDKTDSKGKIVQSPRDNVVYEAGLFAGKLGIARVFLLVDARGTKIPTDWEGLGYVTFDPSTDAIRDVVHQAAVKIGKEITDWNENNATSFEQRISGYWWQFVINKNDGPIASLLKIYYSKPELAWKISGRSWSSEGKEVARYWSRAAILDTRDLKLFYYWEGDHPFDKSIPKFFGVGEIQFNNSDIDSISTAEGWYSQSPLIELSATNLRSTRYERASESDNEIVNKKSDRFALENLISSRISKGE